jgi:hypothetical protein
MYKKSNGTNGTTRQEDDFNIADIIPKEDAVSDENTSSNTESGKYSGIWY